MTDKESIIKESTIYLIDDDDAFRRSLVFLLESVGWNVRDFNSAITFMEEHEDVPVDLGCLVLDIRMPVMSGLHLQQRLHSRGWSIPIVFITGHGDVELAVQAMKSGACDFLEKPFRDQALLDAVENAVRQGCHLRRTSERRAAAQEALSHLSQREYEVARLLALGQPNKLVARSLGISEKTVHVHRQRIMDKASVSSAAELAHLMLLTDPDLLDQIMPPVAED